MAGAATATPFGFGDDFRSPVGGWRRDAEAEAAAEQARAAERRTRELAEAEAFARGVAAGRAEAEREQARLRADALSRIADASGQALAAVDARLLAVEDDALAFFEALARALAGQALAARPLGGVAQAALEAFRHLRGVPHLVARVHESLVEDVDGLLRGLAREHGFEGRIVVLGFEDIAPGDARLEWADGGVSRDARDLQAAAEAVLARTFIPSDPGYDL